MKALFEIHNDIYGGFIIWSIGYVQGVVTKWIEPYSFKAFLIGITCARIVGIVENMICRKHDM